MAEIRKWQKDFIKKQFEQQHLSKFTLIVCDLIDLYGALSDADGDGLTSVVKLNYWPDDLLSEYAMDLPFFAANAKRHINTIKVHPSPDGAVWE